VLPIWGSGGGPFFSTFVLFQTVRSETTALCVQLKNNKHRCRQPKVFEINPMSRCLVKRQSASFASARPKKQSISRLGQINPARVVQGIILFPSRIFKITIARAPSRSPAAPRTEGRSQLGFHLGKNRSSFSQTRSPPKQCHQNGLFGDLHPADSCPVSAPKRPRRQDQQRYKGP